MKLEKTILVLIVLSLLFVSGCILTGQSIKTTPNVNFNIDPNSVTVPPNNYNIIILEVELKDKLSNPEEFTIKLGNNIPTNLISFKDGKDPSKEISSLTFKLEDKNDKYIAYVFITGEKIEGQISATYDVELALFYGDYLIKTETVTLIVS